SHAERARSSDVTSGLGELCARVLDGSGCEGSGGLLQMPPRRERLAGRDGGASFLVWILVVGAPQVVERPDGGAAVLRELGCRVEIADLWDRIDAPTHELPTAVLVEALDQVEAGRAALVRLRAEPPLAEVPILVAVTVPALQRLQPADAFDDIVLVP